MAIERLTIADYSKLDNKPILIGDLDAITPEANTYYKHNGADETTYTKGVIYYYDGTTFKAMTGGGIDKVKSIDTFVDDTKDIEMHGNQGMSWGNTFEMYDENDQTLAKGTMWSQVPIVAGQDVKFDLDEENQVVKIKAKGGIELYDTRVESGGDEAPEELSELVNYGTYAAKTYEGQRAPQVGDLLIYDHVVANSKGQSNVLSRIISVDTKYDPDYSWVDLEAICFLEGEKQIGGGGTTLNKYRFYVDSSTVNQTAENRARVYRIFEQAKGKVSMGAMSPTGSTPQPVSAHFSSANGRLYLSLVAIYYASSTETYSCHTMYEYINSNGAEYKKYHYRQNSDGTLKTSNNSSIFSSGFEIEYYNDVEIV